MQRVYQIEKEAMLGNTNELDRAPLIPRYSSIRATKRQSLFQQWPTIVSVVFVASADGDYKSLIAFDPPGLIDRIAL